MPALFTPIEINNLLDQIGQYYVCLLGDETANAGIGDGTYGTSKALTDLQSVVIEDFTNFAAITALAPSIANLGSTQQMQPKVANDLTDLLSRINNYIVQCGVPGVQNLETFLTYKNVGAGGTWLTLQAPAVRRVQEALGAPDVKVWNYYEELLTTGDTPDGLARQAGATYTDGAEIDTARHVGGFGYLVTNSITGAGVVTVTGSGWDPVTQSALFATTWTANVVGPGSALLVPAVANALIQDVTAIEFGVGITTADVVVESRRPAGRLQLRTV